MRIISPQQMFTIVDVINEKDLAPAPEKLTRSPHVITGTVTRQEVTSC